MRRHPFILTTIVLLTGTLGCFGADSKAKTEVTGDAPPVLLSTYGNAPKWKNLAQLQSFAAQRDPQACFELGNRYYEGDDVPQNRSRAIELFQVAAQGGIANASFRLGKIYCDGIDVPVDYARALSYYSVAARAGVFEAQHNIGVMLVGAKGVKRDYVEGLAWLILATKSGAPDEVEKQVRTRLAKYPARIQAAEVRVSELQKDLAHAEVRAEVIGLDEPPTAAPVIAAPSIAPPDKPVVPLPKVEPARQSIGLPPNEPLIPPGASK